MLHDISKVQYKPLDPLDVDAVREWLHSRNEMAVGHLIYAASHHACEGITHADRKLLTVCEMLRSVKKENCWKIMQQAANLANEVKHWMFSNPVRMILMVVGLGGTAFKAMTIARLMEDKAANFIQWSLSAATLMRFVGFVGVMMIRLVVSTLVPPTSPAFGIILQAATPESQKWTAMPFFLAASTCAGAVPYLLDKLFEVFLRQDFTFTMQMKRFTGAWPLTFWTAPTMMKVFQSANGGKMGASLAVIVAHAAPFMGAQTTNMQRYFLPHPLDTILSQPFGMSEDLISMAMAEAMSNPTNSSVSLTVLIVGFNMAQFIVFSGCKDHKAFASAIFSTAIGWIVVYKLLKEAVLANKFVIVGLQLAMQMLVVPFTLSLICECARRCRDAFCGQSKRKALLLELFQMLPSEIDTPRRCCCCRFCQGFTEEPPPRLALPEAEVIEEIQELLSDSEAFAVECNELLSAWRATEEGTTVMTPEQFHELVQRCDLFEGHHADKFEGRIATICAVVEQNCGPGVGMQKEDFRGFMACILTQIIKELESCIKDESDSGPSTPRNGMADACPIALFA